MKPNPCRRSGARPILALGALLLLSSIALGLAPPRAQASPVAYTLYGATEGWGFTSSAITSPGPDLYAKTGEAVELTLKGGDNPHHNFYVDYNGNGGHDTGEPLSPDFQGTDSSQQYSFTATTEAGIYTYYCNFHPNRMFGRFVVTVNQAPTASFTYLPTLPSAGQIVLFNASSSSDPDGTIVSYDWDFGDGLTGSGELVNHAFEAEGSYIVTLTVTDDSGTIHSSEQTLTISRTPRENNPPVANFTFSPETPWTGQLVVFDGSSSYDDDPEDRVSLYVWDFGDDTGTSSVLPKTSHAYAFEGTFTVTLNATDSLAPQKTNTVQKTIVVKAAIHDVSIVSVAPSVNYPSPGGNVTIAVVVKNEGSVSETFSVVVYYGSTELREKIVSSLAPGSTEEVTLNWDTTGINSPRYTVTVRVNVLPGETDVADNSASLVIDLTRSPSDSPLAPYFPFIIGALVIGVAGPLAYLAKGRLWKRSDPVPDRAP